MYSCRSQEPLHVGWNSRDCPWLETALECGAWHVVRLAHEGDCSSRHKNMHKKQESRRSSVAVSHTPLSLRKKQLLPGDIDFCSTTCFFLFRCRCLEQIPST
eukprot:COSAG01_NODE_36031_length_523_cov_1.224057_1_plen_101_part_10